MQYLEGETLDDRLKKGALPLDQALGRAIEIADALDKAHRQGIVHRDLKPGNVMLTKSGARLLDFGLAKQQPAIAAAMGGASAMPTEGSPLTAQGSIIGTLQYMSPEQLEGKDADPRTDIFAFGALLYEMVTGRRAFEGKSQVSLIAAIIDHDPPPISSLQSVSPPLLDHLVKTCLAKNPEKRWQMMADVLIELKVIAEYGTQLGTLGVTARVKRRLRLATATAAGLLVISAALAAMVMFGARAPEAAKISFDVVTPSSPSQNHIALSPDGKRLALIAQSDKGGVLWVRALDQLNGQVLPGTEGATWPFWSPDGRFIAFFAGGKLKKGDIFGAPPQTLADAAIGTGGTRNRDGTIVFAPTPTGPLFRVSASGGVPAQLTDLDRSRQETAHRHPGFLPDGKHFFYVALSDKADYSGFHVGSIDSKERKQVVSSTQKAMFAPPDHILFMRKNTLMAQRFDLKRLELDGDPFPIAEQVGLNPANGAAAFTVSDNGVLAYRTGAGGDTHLVWLDRAGKQVEEVGVAAPYQNQALSPDLQRVAVFKPDGSAGDIWLFDLIRGTTSKFTFDAGIDNAPVWSPDGTRLVFGSNRGGTFDLYLKNSGGVGQDEVLLKSDHAKIPDDWSLDGRFILYRDQDPKTGSDLWALPLTGDRKPQPVLQTPFEEVQGRFSPDVKWIAYVSSESGTPQVYVQSFPASGTKYQISSGGGYQPRWRSDGKELFFISAGWEMMAVEVSTSKDGVFQAGVPRKLFQANPISITAHRNSWDMTPDGQRFLINSGSTTTAIAPITMVLSWAAGLNK